MSKRTEIKITVVVAVVALALLFSPSVMTQEPSDNYTAMQLVLTNAAKCTALVEQFEKGTILLADGSTEVTLTVPQINALKAAYAALRTEGIAAWNSVTAQ